MTREIIRQGDVLLVPVTEDKVTEEIQGATWTSPNRVVLARGEATGHIHAFDGGVVGMPFSPWYADGEPPKFVRVSAGGALLRHGTPDKDYRDGDHAPVEVPEGTWQVRVQREVGVPRAVD